MAEIYRKATLDHVFHLVKN